MPTSIQLPIYFRKLSEIMGGRPSKIRKFCRKAIRNKNQRAAVSRRVGSCASTAQLNGIGEQQRDGGGEGEEVMLLGIWSREGEEQQFEMEEEDEENERWSTQNALDELAEMEKEMVKILGGLRTQIGRLENEQKRKLQICSKKWRNSSLVFENGGLKNRKKLESLTEECRLRNALLADKFRNCTEYLQGFDSLIRSIQKEQHKNEDDDFLREFLLKTAKRQQKKGQLSQAVDTFCQLLIATNGQLRSDEMAVLADVCREKIEHTREFHERISRVVRQQMDNSPFVVDELWGSVLEELRAECADAYEIMMRVKPAWQEEENDGQMQNVEQLKYLLASTICALWLQITPYGHDEFDEVKELFFRTLDQYMKICPFEKDNKCVALDLEKTIRNLLGQYPKLAGTKKMRKIAERIFCGTGKEKENLQPIIGGETAQILVEY